jgi:hypothetical protein
MTAFLCDYCGKHTKIAGAAPRCECGEWMQPRRELIMMSARDAASSFMYYDRKEDVLSVDQLDKAIDAGEVTLDEIAAEFRKGLGP